MRNNEEIPHSAKNAEKPEIQEIPHRCGKTYFFSLFRKSCGKTCFSGNSALAEKPYII